VSIAWISPLYYHGVADAGWSRPEKPPGPLDGHAGWLSRIRVKARFDWSDDDLADNRDTDLGDRRS
jgi:hypothetical protein